MNRFNALLFVSVLLLGCSSGESTGPGEISGDGTPVTVLVEFNSAGGTFTATVNEKLYSSSPGFVVIPSGTREISGSFTGQFLHVGFGGFADGGGVELNSVASSSGPSAVVKKCGVTYSRATTGTSTFKLSFKVVTKVGGHC